VGLLECVSSLAEAVSRLWTVDLVPQEKDSEFVFWMRPAHNKPTSISSLHLGIYTICPLTYREKGDNKLRGTLAEKFDRCK
jgi:hypothetical protein